MSILELSRLIVSLADLKKGDKVYNPFAGLASVGVLIDPEIEYIGQEINSDTRLLGLFRLFVHLGKYSFDFILLGDSIENWNPKEEKYDLIVTTPPFNMRMNTDFIRDFKSVKSVEQLLIISTEAVAIKII